MSAAVVESGTTVWVRHFGFRAAPGEAVRYPIASLTKPFSAVLALQLVQGGKLRLDAVRHLLTHTSTGTPGKRFVYSSELYSTLQGPLERAAGAPLHVALAGGVVKPARLAHTVVPARTTPSAGMESTVEDLAHLATALERDTLLSAGSRSELFRVPRGPTGHALPYALGWFVQHVGGEEIRWHFGQQQDASSLLIIVPRRRLSLAVLARTDRLSAPFWMQLGDVRWSPVAAGFLTAWPRIRMDLAEGRRTMREALAALHMGARDAARKDVERALVLAPALGDAADGALLAAFARSGDADLRAVGRRIAKRLFAVDDEHPRTLLDLAVLNLEDGQPQEARKLLNQIVAGRAATPEILRTTRDLLNDIRGS